ncbi:MAG: PilZ domain-containing protein [Cystobacterineae bacterium]|nr:PilZ domain-containing protein [Cystobacterineae bacterium]
MLQPTAGPRRYHPRVVSRLTAKLWIGSHCSVVRILNLSMAGVCVVGSLPDYMERVHVCIGLPHGFELKVFAKVKRQEQGLLALEFETLDWDALIALARYLHPRFS